MADDLKSLGDDLVNALTEFRDHTKIRLCIPCDDAFFLRVLADEAAPPKRLRSMSVEGTGRGRGRGAKEPARKLTRLLKPKGRRAEFVQFIGGNGVSISSVMARFGMSRPNVNGFLTNIHRDHGIGYFKDNADVRLILPAGATWSNIWG